MPITGKGLNPNQTNPYRDLDSDTERKLDEVKRFVAGIAFAAQAREAFEVVRQKKGGG